MKVILKQDIPKVGGKYDILDISDGYALNFLIPKGLAEVATKDKVVDLETMKAKKLEKKKEEEDLWKKELEKINGKSFEIVAKVNEKGNLFAGLNPEDIIENINKQIGSSFKAEHLVENDAVKKVGEYQLSLKLEDKEVKFTLVVKAE